MISALHQARKNFAATRAAARLLLLAVISTPGYAAPAPQVCVGNCPKHSPAGSQLSRHCDPGGVCNVGCDCKDVIGDAVWDPKRKIWAGSFHDCYCLVAGGATQGSKKCSGAYEWKVHQVKGGKGLGTVYVFEFTDNDESFVRFFEDKDVLPSGKIAASSVIFSSGGGFSGSLKLLDITKDPNDTKRILEVVDFSGTTGPANLMGYSTGPCSLLPDPAYPHAKAVYDTQRGTIESMDWTRATVVNGAFPLGLPFLLDLSLVKVKGQWYARGQARGDFPVRLSHVYDAGSNSVTLTVDGIAAGTKASIYYSAACLGDVDRDRDVDMDDYDLAKAQLGQCLDPLGCTGDVDANGVIDEQDLQVILNTLGCSDFGTYTPAGCVHPVFMQNPGVFTAVAGQDEKVVITIPLGSLPLSAFYLQAVQVGQCTYSNVLRITLP